MKLRLNSILISLALLVLSTIQAYSLFGKNTDTTLMLNGYNANIKYIVDTEKLPPDVVAQYERQSMPQSRYTVDIDTARMMFDKKVAIEANKYEGSNNTYISSIKCENGMMLLIQYPAPMARYYPDEKIITIQYIEMGLSLVNGERAYDPGYVKYSVSNKLRCVPRDIVNDDQSVTIDLQVYNRNTKKYMPLFKNTQSLFNLQPFQSTFLPYMYIWKGETLYLSDSEGWWTVTVDAAPKKTPLKP